MGYNCLLGACTSIQRGRFSWVMPLTFLSIFVTLVFTNVSMWRMARNSSQYFRDAKCVLYAWYTTLQSSKDPFLIEIAFEAFPRA